MRVRICYTIDIDDKMRRAIREYYGKDGLATREEIVSWYRLNGSSIDDDLSADNRDDNKSGEEPDNLTF